MDLRYGEKAIRDSKLETWANPEPNRMYEIKIEFPEFTCKCPRSGHPDFATITIIYIPKLKVVELKSLKYYLNRYREEYISHEGAANRILNDLKCVLEPFFIKVIADFSVRGGAHTIVTVQSPEAA